MDKTNHLRTSCWFCEGCWGECACSFTEGWIGDPVSDGFLFDGTFITQPNVSENTIGYVDPAKYYGEAFTKWWEHHKKNPTPCDDHCLGHVLCRHDLWRYIS